MFRSLSSRVAALSAVVILAMLALVAALVDASVQTRASFRWVNHSSLVIETLGEALVELREAESGQRGFALTHNPDFATSFERRTAGAREAIDRVVQLTADNKMQRARALEMRKLIAQRIVIMQIPFNLSRKGDFDRAGAIIARGRGRDIMETPSSRGGAGATSWRR